MANARLEFRVNDRKQTFAIKSNRERMALSFHENQSKTAGPAKSGGTQTARRMLLCLRVNRRYKGTVSCYAPRIEGEVLRVRRLPDPKTSGRRMRRSLRY